MCVCVYFPVSMGGCMCVNLHLHEGANVCMHNSSQKNNSVHTLLQTTDINKCAGTYDHTASQSFCSLQ